MEMELEGIAANACKQLKFDKIITMLLENKMEWPYQNFDLVLFANKTMTDIKCGWAAAYCRYVF